MVVKFCVSEIILNATVTAAERCINLFPHHETFYFKYWNVNQKLPVSYLQYKKVAYANSN